MDTLKELVIDALLLFAALFIVSAQGIAQHAGLTCGRAESAQTSSH